MRRLRYHLVDVFTDRAFGGNQLAVFTNGRGVPADLMQSIARELNLAETTFVLPPEDPDNDFHVRIFTPAAELPMAGHPTVGTAFVLAREQMIERSGNFASTRFEEGVGVIPVNLTYAGDEPGFIWMTQPGPRFGPEYPNREVIAHMLSLAPESIDANLPVEVVSCGVPFLYVPVTSLKAVRGIKLRTDVWERALKDFVATGVFVFTREVETQGATVHSRMFAPGIGIGEDPATGAASGPLGCYLVRHGLVPSGSEASPTARIVSEQGLEMGRPSFIHIEIDQEEGQITGVRVGGQVVYIGEGALELS
jgi:trans-2,3-dihydro-3-hydroxyanthranilate isomerase